MYSGWRTVPEYAFPVGEFGEQVFEGSGVVGRFAASAAEGRQSEDRFREVCKRCLPADRYPYVKTTTLREDVRDHVDVEVSVVEHPDDDESFSRHVCKVDVKAPKRASRSGDFTDDVMWVELRTRNGRPGWVYGKADLVAQEVHRKGFVMMSRDALRRYAESQLAKNPGCRHVRDGNPKEVLLRLGFADCVERSGVCFWPL